MSAHSPKAPEILDKIVDVVLSYKPKKIAKTAKNAAKKRAKRHRKQQRGQ